MFEPFATDTLHPHIAAVELMAMLQRAFVGNPSFDHYRDHIDLAVAMHQCWPLGTTRVSAI